jgi:death on curing protein
VPIHYPEFGDFCDAAAEILGTTPKQIARLPNVGLAESALASPRAGFGDVEVYSTILEKAAILVARLARNHPLPDGNKRTAFTLMGLFLEANGTPLDGLLPDVDVPMVERDRRRRSQPRGDPRMAGQAHCMSELVTGPDSPCFTLYSDG